MAASEQPGGSRGGLAGFSWSAFEAGSSGREGPSDARKGTVSCALQASRHNADGALHDRIVARRIEKLVGKIDIIHTWPLGSLETLKAAKRLGIPTVLERCNAHTGFAMEVVQKECDRLGITLPADHEHAYNAEKLHKEEEEYRLADPLLVPFGFCDEDLCRQGISAEQIGAAQYGYDERNLHSQQRASRPEARINDDLCGGLRRAERFALCA